MDFFEMISFAKLFSQSFSGNLSLSDAEMEAASSTLKKLGDSCYNWSPAQKEIYKAMVDYAKNRSQGKM